MSKQASTIEKTSNKITRIGATISAIIVIITAATGICTWVSNQFQSVVSEQISELQQEVKNTDARQEQSLTRLELIMLIEHNPENKAEIEKVARYYFITLNGDWYMTGLYTQWAEEHGGDITIILGKD